MTTKIFIDSDMAEVSEKAGVSLKELFMVFMKIGAFTIGGGYAMIPLIKDELDRRKWIGEDELPDIIALAQSAPGILAVNVSIFTYYKIRGVKGSIAATIGSVLPSFMIILAIAMAFTSFKDNPVVISIFKGIRLGGGIIDSGPDHLDGKEILQDMVGVDDCHSQPSAGIFPGGLPYLYHNVGHRARFGRR